MERIVVGIDGSEASQHALEWGIAHARPTGARVAAVTAAPDTVLLAPTEGLAWMPSEHLEEEAHLLQDSVVDRVDTGGVDVERVVMLGHPWQVLHEQTLVSDLLVIGSQGLGALSGALLGSVSHQAVSHGTCPVVVVPRATRPPSRIVVGVDGSEESQRALAWAAEVARAHGAAVDVVLAYQYTAAPPMGAPFATAHIALPDPSQTRDAAFDRLGAAVAQVDLDGLRVEQTVIEGPIARRLLERAADANLLVVGSRGLGGFKGILLGSVSHRVLRHATCPVAVVH